MIEVIKEIVVFVEWNVASIEELLTIEVFRVKFDGFSVETIYLYGLLALEEINMCAWG